MKKYFLLALAIIIAVPVYASEITGTLTTGVSTGIGGTVVSTPVASPVAGTYSSAQSVTLTATDTTSIHYTIDGASPTCTTGTVYSGAISVSESETIRAVGCSGTTASAVGTFAYGINITPPGGGGGGGGSSGGIITPPLSGGTPGDITGDNVVDLIDFNAIVVDWGKTGSSLSSDLNHDGVVDILDFNILIINWTL